MAAVATTAIEKPAEFVKRQRHNRQVATSGSAVNSFLLNLTGQYDSIYTVALAANSVELGTINRSGNGLSAAISMPVGWLMDDYGPKPFYLLGKGLLARGALFDGLAPTWQAMIAATILFSISTRLTGTGCSVMGRFRGLVTIPASLLGRLVWEELVPAYVFVLPPGVDLLLKVFLLTTIAEMLAA